MVANIEEQLILSMLCSHNLCARRIQRKFSRLHGITLGTATLHNILTRNEVIMAIDTYGLPTLIDDQLVGDETTFY